MTDDETSQSPETVPAEGLTPADPRARLTTGISLGAPLTSAGAGIRDAAEKFRRWTYRWLFLACMVCGSAVLALAYVLQPDATAPRPSSPNAAAHDSAVIFDTLAPGLLPSDAFVGMGTRLSYASGELSVYISEPNMVMPAGHNHVMLVGGGPETTLTISFKTPVNRFALTRVGTTGGASLPTWTLEATDANGNVIASAGEKHGLPSQPRQIVLEASGIYVVTLSTDNRFGKRTWATWNSLPVTEFAVSR